MIYRSAVLHVIGDPKVGNNIFKQNTQNAKVTTDLLNSENLEVAIAQLCNEK